MAKILKLQSLNWAEEQLLIPVSFFSIESCSTLTRTTLQ